MTLALFGPGAKRSRSTPAGTTVYAPGKRAAAFLGDLVARRQQPVDPGEQPVALVPAGREAEALRDDEGTARRRLRLEQGDVREPGNGRVEPVHDVEGAAAQRRGDVRRTPTGNPTAERGVTGTARETATTPSGFCGLESSTTGEELGRPRGRREHDDRVAPFAQRLGDARDVLVGVVRHRPRMWCYEADPKRHGPRL